MKVDTLLVTPEMLADHLDDPDWVVIDTRHELTDPEKGPRAYAAGHIPGAHFMHVDYDLSGSKTGANGRHPLPDIHVFVEKLNQRGVGPGKQVVVYDDSAGCFAVRLWWMLRWLGHDRVALLDGGYPLWVKEGRQVTTDTPAPRKGAFVPRPRSNDAVDVHYVSRLSRSPEMKLIDARAVERFSGEQETIDPVAGHVPGAMNRFWRMNVQPDGQFKPAAELREEFGDLLGAGEPAKVVHMCGSGITACHNLFAMELAGMAGSLLYPGSWSEWCADPGRAVATGQ